MKFAKGLCQSLVLITVSFSIVFQLVTIKHDSRGCGLEVQQVQQSGKECN